MEKIKFLALLMFISLSVLPVFSSSKNKTEIAAIENTLTKEEASTLTTRVEEIRDMDKSELSASEKSELKNELKEIKATMKNQPYIYIGGGTLILILILLIILV